MTTVFLYARYSTSLQSQESVEDQFHLLRQRAERESWLIVGEGADRAISGTVRDRPGLQDAMRAIERGEAAVLLAESLDRISRDQEDLANLFKRVRFAGASIVTLSEGTVGAIHIGMGGTMSAMFLEQLAEKVRRGHIGRVNAGRIPGGLSYGYRAVREFDAQGEPVKGLREIDPDQAAIVRRIFVEYAAGTSPVRIAHQLNAEGIASPRGGLWRANAITGHRARGNGILHNQLYIGRLVYNRQSFRKDPLTRKRVSRANDASELVTHDVPELAIIEADLWAKVQQKLERQSGQALHLTRRPKRLLSGLIRCGECGGTVTIVTGDRWGCSTSKQSGTCRNGVTISNRLVEQRVFAAIQRELLHPEVIAEYLKELRIMEAELRRARMARRAESERRLAQLTAEQANIANAIVSGLPPETFIDRAKSILEEKTAIENELQRLPAQDSVSIHPATVAAYTRLVEDLHATIRSTTDSDLNLRRLLEALIDHVEMRPRLDGTKGADLILHGDLAALLSIDAKKPLKAETLNGEHTVKMVAGVGFEPTTFRL